MKTTGRNKLPLWARYFGVLIGFPAIVGVLRAVLEHLLPRLTADYLLVAILIIVCIPLFWKRKKHTRHVHMTGEEPQGEEREEHAQMTKEERHYEKREELKLYFLMFAMFAIVLLAGTFFGFCIMFSATPQSYPELLYGVFRLFGAAIGIVCLVLAFVCFQQSKAEFLLLKGVKPSSEVSVSGKTAICALVITLAIAFAIARVFRL